MKFDHVAINVSHVRTSVEWYQTHLDANVLYQDETWALLEAGGAKIALTLPSQHPSHLAFDVGSRPTDDFLRTAQKHRDASISQYIDDPDGNAIEWIYYPPART